MLQSAKISAAVFGALLAATLVSIWVTRESSSRSGTPGEVMDRRLVNTARQMASFVETSAEQELALEARRLTDHELDQAFASALREAAAYRPPTKGPLAGIRARIDQAKVRIAADRERIAKLPQDSGSVLDLAKAQLALDEDELEDAQADLAREGGDPYAALQRALTEHAAVQHDATVPKLAAPAPTITLAEQLTAWLRAGDQYGQIDAARQQAVARGSALSHEHDSLEALIAQKPVPSAEAGDPEFGEDNTVMVARLRNLSDQRKTLTELDRRVQDSAQIAGVYSAWGGLIDARRRDIGRLLLHSLSLVFGVLLLAVVVESMGYRVLRDRGNRHRAHQQRFVFSFAVRAAGLIGILLIVFGPPNQISTIIGLVTAGLTVVLKDFVLAFIGWFVLMGRNGVRIGDWVEINGVGGEVIEIGLFKTVLLEMGTGHPTGRRVSMMNGYAFEGRWFNFSTAGQWLWDELQVSVPAGVDPYGTAQRIREVVERETEANAQLAEQDWERITKQYGTRSFSARPAVNLRPGGGGLEVHVRYITRGPERYEMKSKLFKEIVELMRGPGA